MKICNWYRKRLESTLIPSWNNIVKSKKIIYSNHNLDFGPKNWKDEKWNHKHHQSYYESSNRTDIQILLPQIVNSNFLF